MAATRQRMPQLRTLVTTGEVLDPETREELRALARDVRDGRDPPAVVAAWAPDGARALWAECRGGDAFHTWPAAELIQAIGSEAARDIADGDLVWSSLAWRGSVLLRLRTGAAGRLDRTPCPTCGRTTPRVRVVPLG